ncbi:MAG: DNA primase [Planctomycetes bacterium]|nr:DNA primase [Planctomycetota bacterium]
MDGRRIDDHTKADLHYRIAGGIFNVVALSKFDELILADSILNALTFHAAGHDIVIALQDVDLSSEMLTNVKRLLLSHANTDEGNAEVARIAASDLVSNIELHRITFPKDFDANQYAIAYKTVPDALSKRIRVASWVDPRGVGFQPAKEALPANDANHTNAETRCGRSPDRVTNADRRSPEPSEPVTSPVPAPIQDLEAIVTETEVTIEIEQRRWRIRGLDRNTISGVMKVNVLVFHNERFHVDTLDLYHSRSRRLYLAEAADEVGAAEATLRSDLGRVLLKLEQLQGEQANKTKQQQPEVKLTDAERSEALELLKDEHLLDHILDDFDTCGIVGERTGKLVGYLAATSRKRQRPLGLVVQSSSAAGKTSLMDAVLSFMPPEEQFACSAMTSQSLYYMQNENLQHKILSVAEEEGVRDASYALKLLQSEGHLSIVTTGRETGTGRTAIERYEVEGPVALLLTTTATNVDEELMNRCLVISVDEESTQTEAIHQRQRESETLEGFTSREQAKRVRQLHQNAQRLLRPIEVINPYAEQLQFTSLRVRNRRDHAKYLSLIRAVTFLHQHQREVKQATINEQEVEYIEVTKRDITVANTIADAILGRSIDELPMQTRTLLRQLHEHVKQTAKAESIATKDVHFTRRQIREALQWGQTQIKLHLDRLFAYEYVVVHLGPGRTQLYELQWDGRGNEGQLTLCGLVDPSKLKKPSTTT